jgi:hypothetical protein
MAAQEAVKRHWDLDSLSPEESGKLSTVLVNESLFPYGDPDAVSQLTEVLQASS